MARNKRVAQIAPEPPKPLVPYVTVERISFNTYRVELFGLEEFSNGTYGDRLTRIKVGYFWGRERSSRIATRSLNRHLRKVSYTREPKQIFKAKAAV